MRSSRIFPDQLQRKVTVSFPPERIISLVPSQTELLAYFGLDEQVIGITKFCIHPAEWFRSKTRVGGTKQLNMEKIHQLQPDLIIGNKEENEQAQIESLMKKYPVWMSDIRKLVDALDMIERVGEMTGKSAEAKELVRDISDAFGKMAPIQPTLKAAYLIWQKPYMVSGSDTFINDMMGRCGFENAFGDHHARYPEISLDELIEKMPEVILLSSEPFPFKEKHRKEFQQMIPNAKVLLADGEMFSWYGSRLTESAMYFKKLLINL